MEYIIHFTDTYRNVFEQNDAFVSGSVFDGNKLLSAKAIAEEIYCIKEPFLSERLNAYNGFFAFVFIRNGELFAAVDKIRSIPLFYSINENIFFISNDAEWLQNKIEDKSISESAKQEFLLAGYVTGSDTLCDKIKQLQAGEYLHINDNLHLVRYFRFLHTEPESQVSKNGMLRKLNSIMDNIIKRLVTYANGRQIVIPLSAGRDSRLIALKLKEHEYPHVICFSYGVKGNFEAETSQIVAEQLEFPWFFIEYTEEKWRAWFRTVEREKYYKMAMNLCSLPVIQDLPAVMDLKANGTLADDALLVPGHSADFPAGSHIPSEAFEGLKVTEKTLISTIMALHYSLVCWPRLNEKQKLYWNNRILWTCEVETVTNNIQFVDFFEKWDWQERQAKFIVNSVKVYEYFGYDWWLPFWDNDFIQYWQSVSLYLRKDKLLYNEYVDELSVKFISSNIIDKNDVNKQAKIFCYLKIILKHLKVYNLLRSGLHLFKTNDKKFVSTNGFIGMYSTDFLYKNQKTVNSINGLNTVFIMDEIHDKTKNN